MCHKRSVAFSFLPGLIYGYLVFLDQQKLFLNAHLRFYLFVSCVLSSMVLFTWLDPSLNRKRSLFFSILTVTTFHQLVQFMQDISSSPWSLNWSEGSRFYYASLFLDQKIYGIEVPLSVLHPTRYLMQAVPFLIPDNPILLHRLWQVLLWLVTICGTGYTLARRLSQHTPLQGKFPTVAYVAWSLLFLMQGPVYYHLLVMVMLIIWGIRNEHFGHSLVVVLLASLWAGLSRLNWFPVPALLAATMYLLERPISFQRRSNPNSKWQFLCMQTTYLYRPALWILFGTAAAFISQKAYIIASGNPSNQFNSSLTSDLLWYRLFPNATNSVGILPLGVFVSIPMIMIMIYYSRQQYGNVAFLRKLALVSITCVLFVGGLVVSVKIGGGADLHNLDAYLVFIWVIGTYSYFGDITPDQVGNYQFHIPELLAWPALLIPVVLTVSFSDPSPNRDIVIDRTELRTLERAFDDVKGEVLFLSQRQLLAFRELHNLSLTPEYEGVFLMEMTLANNQEYLEKFHTDVAAHRYTYIVSYPLTIIHKGEYFPFGEENDAWVDKVSIPILCHYEPMLTLNGVNVQLLAPRNQSCEAP